jgi:hypothetical protein
MSDATTAVLVAAIAATPPTLVALASLRRAKSVDEHVKDQLTPSNGTKLSEMIERTDSRVERVESRVDRTDRRVGRLERKVFDDR